MTKKKRGGPTLEEVLARPWCYYCERDFDDMTVLLSHQKAKHYKCERCGRRLNTAGGLSVHMNQVHKENLEKVENALPNRQDPGIEIFGTEGIPEDVVQQHRQRVIAHYHEEVAERRAATGNPPPGAGAPNPAKKPKTETPAEMKQRLAEHRAKKAAEAAANAEARSQAQQSQSPIPAPGQDVFQQYMAPQSNSHQPPFSQSPYHQHGFSTAGQPPGAFSSIPPGVSMPGHHAPPGISQYHTQPMPYAPSPPGQYAHMSPYSRSPGAMSFAHARPPPGQSMSPPQSGGLGAPPGLPQRPTQAPPQAGSSQSHQMPLAQAPGIHQSANGAAPGDPRLRAAQANAAVSSPTTQTPLPPSPAQGAFASAGNDFVHTKTPSAPAVEEGQGEKVEKKAKKDKDKPTRLVYSDNEITPEEKMAKLAGYAVNPGDLKEPPVVDNALGAHVAGTADGGEDDLIDKQD